jgi:Legionella pneumophila major outer membrane protein precursor
MQVKIMQEKKKLPHVKQEGFPKTDSSFSKKETSAPHASHSSPRGELPSSKHSLHKAWPFAATALAVSLVALTGFKKDNDSSHTHYEDLNTRVTNLEKASVGNPPLTPAARPVVQNGADFFFQGSALYWQASESGLDYAMTWRNNIPTDGASPDFGGKGTLHHPKFKWDWGFKLGTGYNMAHDGWDLFLDWTRFHTQKQNAHCGNNCPGSSSSVTPFIPGDNPSSVVYPLLFPANMIPGPTDTDSCCNENIGPGYLACMDWRVRLDMIDLELGREFFVSKWLTLRPHAGLRDAWINQRGSVHYQGNIISETTAADFAIALKNNFWGIGPRAGIDGQWGLCRGFSLYSELAASLLLGYFKISEFQTPSLAVPSGSPAGPIIAAPTTVAIAGSDQSFREKYTAARMVADLALGVRYQTSFYDDSYGLMLDIGWEQHMFFGQNQLTRLTRSLSPAAFTTNQNNNAFTPVTNQGDLSTQGVTFTAKVDF